MNDSNKPLRDALRQEDADLLDDFGVEPSTFDMITETFRGRNRRIMMLTAFWIVVLLFLGIFSAVQFCQAEATRDMLMWAVAVIFCLSGVPMMKVMRWMDVNKNAVTG